MNSQYEAKEIFLDEIDALTSLDHPHVVKMYEYGIDGKIQTATSSLSDIWFLVLEYISERTLVDLVKEQGALSEELSKYFFF